MSDHDDINRLVNLANNSVTALGEILERDHPNLAALDPEFAMVARVSGGIFVVGSGSTTNNHLSALIGAMGVMFHCQNDVECPPETAGYLSALLTHLETKIEEENKLEAETNAN